MIALVDARNQDDLGSLRLDGPVWIFWMSCSRRSRHRRACEVYNGVQRCTCGWKLGPAWALSGRLRLWRCTFDTAGISDRRDWAIGRNSISVCYPSYRKDSAVTLRSKGYSKNVSIGKIVTFPSKFFLSPILPIGSFATDSQWPSSTHTFFQFFPIHPIAVFFRSEQSHCILSIGTISLYSFDRNDCALSLRSEINSWELSYLSC